MKRAELQRKLRVVMVRDVPEQNSSFVLKNRKVYVQVFRLYTAQLCCICCVYDNPLT